MVNDYRPPPEKTVADFHQETEERVKHLQLPGFPQVTDQMTQEKLQGKISNIAYKFTQLNLLILTFVCVRKRTSGQLDRPDVGTLLVYRVKFGGGADRLAKH